MTTQTPNMLPQVHVQVTRDAANNWVCIPELAPVTKTNTLIFFNLFDTDYEFDPEKPLVLGHSSDSFPDPAIRRSSTQLTLVDLNLRKGDMSYTLNVVHRGTGERKRVPIDPQIGNQPA